ncbi:hypothetical protein [Paraoerskovia marina]|uniref:hypothetical protein n=1 Tax=Paraoerskovia marina TaxID=545619 RepID=UPI000492D939|nr:hypothetical protein [Paraoerskovia marina]
MAVRPSPRRLIAGTLAAAVLLAWYLGASGGTGSLVHLALVALSAGLGGAILASYVPERGEAWRSTLGCGPCDVVAAGTVLLPALLLGSAPLSASMALVAVLATTFGLVRRRAGTATSCPTSPQPTTGGTP